MVKPEQPVDWRDELARWCKEHPPTLTPLHRDTSGTVSRETMEKVAADFDELLASGELVIRFFTEDEDGDITLGH